MKPQQLDFYYQYDLASSAYVYGRLLGRRQGLAAIETDGSSTTVTASVDGSAPFSAVEVGDPLEIHSDQTVTLRRVATKTDDDEITVDTALNITATTAWYHNPFRSGTAVTDGWHKTGPCSKILVHFQPEAVAAPGGIDWVIQVSGRNYGALPKTVREGNIASTALADLIVEVPTPAERLRVGLKGHSGSTGTDQITVYALATQDE
jgi:hypothetical protein